MVTGWEVPTVPGSSRQPSCGVGSSLDSLWSPVPRVSAAEGFETHVQHAFTTRGAVQTEGSAVGENAHASQYASFSSGAGSPQAVLTGGAGVAPLSQAINVTKRARPEKEERMRVS
jgi:hypothetical protein